jgi:hypothetical protein
MVGNYDRAGLPLVPMARGGWGAGAGLPFVPTARSGRDKDASLKVSSSATSEVNEGAGGSEQAHAGGRGGAGEACEADAGVSFPFT